MLYVPMNMYLLWMWFSTGQWDTIVNKLISIQTLCGILFTIGRTLDCFLRQNSLTPAFLDPDTYCVCWLVINFFIIYMFQTSHFSMAMVRWVCVKYPMEFHTRYQQFQANRSELRTKWDLLLKIQIYRRQGAISKHLSWYMIIMIKTKTKLIKNLPNLANTYLTILVAQIC